MCPARYMCIYIYIYMCILLIRNVYCWYKMHITSTICRCVVQDVRFQECLDALIVRMEHVFVDATL